MPRRKIPVEVITAEYTAGATEEEIAAKYMVTKQAVSLALKRLGVATRPVGRPPKDDYVRRLEQAVKAILGYHIAPGDPAWAEAHKLVPELVPENKCNVSFQ